MLYCRCRSAVERSPQAMSGHDFFLSSFEVLYVDITFTKEFGHLF